MAAVGFNILMFLGFNVTVIGSELIRLLLGERAVFKSLIDAFPLILHPLIHLVAAWVFIGKGSAGGIAWIIGENSRRRRHQTHGQYSKHDSFQYGLHDKTSLSNLTTSFPTSPHETNLPAKRFSGRFVPYPLGTLSGR